MSFLGIDLGGTKLALATFNSSGTLLSREVIALEKRSGPALGELIGNQVKKKIVEEGVAIQSVGVSVPGISRRKTGTVWAPNIPGWEDYPLRDELKKVVSDIPVSIESDRTCCILGEQWQGKAQGCLDAIYLSVGTGIGAGILTNGNVLHGSHDIAGSVGWMALQKPFQKKYVDCGCFEYYGSGEGIAKLTRELMSSDLSYQGSLRRLVPEKITAHDVFAAYDEHDTLALQVIAECIRFWGMATANLISIFNPEKVIFGGGVFGPAIRWIPKIREEAAQWAQPISMQQVSLESSGLGIDAALYGAGYLAMNNLPPAGR